MSKNAQELRDEMKMFADDARALLNATAGLTGEKVIETRKRLSFALENCRGYFEDTEESSMPRFNVMADEFMRKNPYQVMGIAFAVGTLIGCVLAGRD